MRPKGQPHSAAPAFGQPHRHFAHTDSTNSRARELAATGAPHGTVVTAGEQSEGRGRQGRTWTAPPGTALLYSAIVRPLEERHLMLPLAVPLAVCAAAEQLVPGVNCGVKWPNDVHLNGRKLAGILIEARPQDGWAVVGVGLNLFITPEEFPPELRDRAVSLFDSEKGDKRGPRASLPAFAREGSPLVPLDAAQALSAQLSTWLEAEPDAILNEWRQRDVLKGREIAWEDGSGVANGVDDRGYLAVVVPGGDRVFLGAGEVHLRP